VERVTRSSSRTPAEVAVAALVVSVVVHLLLWPLSEVLSLRVGGPSLPRSEGVMEVSLVDPRDAEQSEQAKPEDEEEETTPPEQLVDLDYLERERRPDDAKYVSEFDNDPDRELRAPKNRRGRPAGGDHPDAQDEQQPSSPRQRAGVALPLGGREALSGDEASSKRGESPERGDDRPESDTTKPQTLSPRGARGLPDSLRKEWGSPGTHDALEDDMDIADGNNLKTKRFRHASFFNRVRNSVAQHWHPEVVHAANDPEGRVHGTKTRKTLLSISLNPDGSLHKVRLAKSSNVDYLDEEAIRAVRQAAPFVNPPDDLVGHHGYIEFGFGFIFEIHGGRRIFRYRN
jgi:TonB family protein